MASKNITTKRKKKLWYGLYAPEALNNAFLGETHVYTPDEMIGKTVSLNLSMITNDMKKQNIITSFRVKEIKDNQGMTELVGYSLGLAYLKRLVRRRRDKIDDSFLTKTKDDKTLRIKTVVMTNSKTFDSAISAIRLSLRAKIKKALKEMSFEEFVNALINVRLQKEWKSSLGKIYPLKFLEVRYVSLEEPKRGLKETEEQDLTELNTDDDEDMGDEDDKSDEQTAEDSEIDAEDVEDGDESESETESETDDESDQKSKK
ncbi:MAG: hypothetical protein ACLFN8_04200 [Candidatus Woesearchaeota archaeon]